MEGWHRDMYFWETGLPWVQPSPNIPTPETLVAYPGTCLFEGTNLSEGRGTTRPFEWLGAPWIDGYAWAETINSCNLPGVMFRPVYFTPTFSKHEGTLCQGVEVHVTDVALLPPRRNGTAPVWPPPGRKMRTLSLGSRPWAKSANGSSTCWRAPT